jgi:hypothetical protein
MLRGGLRHPSTVRRLGRGLPQTQRPAASVNLFDAATAVPADATKATVNAATGTISWTGRTAVPWTSPVPPEANTTYAYSFLYTHTSGPSAAVKLSLGSAFVSPILAPGASQTFTGTLITGAGDAGGALSFSPSQPTFVGSVSAISILKQ